MWNYNSDNNKWSRLTDGLSKTTYDSLKQELSSTRLYSKALSGATYVPIKSFDNIYEVLGTRNVSSLYIDQSTSQWARTGLANVSNPTKIDYSYYDKFLPEYGLSLKNLFTPTKLLNDTLNNYIEVDLATVESIDFDQPQDNLIIDGIRVKEGHIVLVKNQKSIEAIASSIDPKTYFKGKTYLTRDLGLTREYEYYDSSNGLYKYVNNKLIKTDILNDYERCSHLSLSIKNGDLNFDKQFHLIRLNDGLYPSSLYNDPMEFVEQKNWMLRNRVDYNNLYEINYYDILKHATQSYNDNGITYSIPSRVISIGEFGVILNTQGTQSITNIIYNKYKENLRSIAETTEFYWICGDNSTLLKIRKHDFNIEFIDLNDIQNFKSISFFSDLKGVLVGDFNTIYITENGGFNWEKLNIPDFDEYSYLKVIWLKDNKIYICGKVGVFIELNKDSNGWNVWKRRISKFKSKEDEYLLVDHINNMIYIDSNYQTNVNWNISDFNNNSVNIGEFILMVTNNGNIILYDMEKKSGFNFLYLEAPNSDNNDIINFSNKKLTELFYLAKNDGLYELSILDYDRLSINGAYSNILSSNININKINSYYVNNIYDWNGVESYIAGNNSLLMKSDYISSYNDVDITYLDRVKPKLLFLDYDIASKLNFFTDQGDYRLPKTLSITASQNNYIINFKSLDNETSWLDYWKDRTKTFEYGATSSAMTDEKTVLISTIFKYNQLETKFGLTYSTTNLDDMVKLAPTISEGNKFTTNIQIVDPSSNDIFIYKYLMILKVDLTYPVEIGDVININSEVIDDNLVVNKIVEFSSYKYIYMFIDWNQGILNDLKSKYINFNNLNKSKTYSELVEKFNTHPISIGYNLNYDNSNLSINSKFNNYTSYYNLALNVDYNSISNLMEYTTSFLDFGYTPTYNLYSVLNNITSNFIESTEFITMPIYDKIPVGQLGDNNIYIPSRNLKSTYNPWDASKNAPFLMNGEGYDGETYIVTKEGSQFFGILLYDFKIGDLVKYDSNTGQWSIDSYTDLTAESNMIYLGQNLKFEWESILENTFIDLNLYTSSDIIETSRLLVMRKYFDKVNNCYVIEFHKNIITNNSPSSVEYIDIISRRRLDQISDDLQELNNIQRRKTKIVYNDLIGASFSTYERELNWKIPTDSYAKILLSNDDIFKNLTGLVYVDYKNELAMNITKLETKYEIPITKTTYSNGVLTLSYSGDYKFKLNQGIVLEFTSGTFSSQYLNQHYFGYQVITGILNKKIQVKMPHGVNINSNDKGIIKIVDYDPFLNYQPVDIMEVGVNKGNKIAIQLEPYNTELVSSKYNLINIDFNKYRYKLMDGLTINDILIKYSWILDAEISKAIIGQDKNGLVWYKGRWETGRWFGGTWVSGSWKSGDWYGGTWNSKSIKDKIISVEIENNQNLTNSTWYDGRWYDGIWENGTWYTGRWYGGNWNNGIWNSGIWNDGTWNNGDFKGGIWVLGTWNNGIFNTNSEPAYWIDGIWNGGDFENGMWYNGIFNQKNSISRFGTKSFNSRTSTWHSGSWVDGDFYSNMTNENNISDIHKYSIWKTGNWYGGNFYGGVAYNINFNGGVWQGGILEEIQVVNIDKETHGSVDFLVLVLNGNFKFNIGHGIRLFKTTKMNKNEQSIILENDPFLELNILKVVEDGDFTKIMVDKDVTNLIGYPNINNFETGLRVVSHFKNVKWKSGIFTNGIFDIGLFEGGIWYDGYFNGKFG